MAMEMPLCRGTYQLKDRFDISLSSAFSAAAEEYLPVTNLKGLVTSGSSSASDILNALMAKPIVFEWAWDTDEGKFKLSHRADKRRFQILPTFLKGGMGYLVMIPVWYCKNFVYYRIPIQCYV